MLIGLAVMALGAFSGDKSAKSLWAALRSSDAAEDVETLTASIEEKRLRIESLEDQFQARGAELAKQFAILDQRRKELKGTDADEVQRFNLEAEAYTAQNRAHKTLGAELESARKQLTGLLDERARLRAANPSDPVQNVEPARGANPVATTATVGKRIVMYTTASCPACVAAKSYLGRKGVYYEERDVERSTEAMNEFRSLGGRGVPLILVGNDRMVGFDPGRFEQLIGG